MPSIAAVEVAFPRNYYGQEELATALLGMASAQRLGFEREQVLRFFSAVGVSGRHLALPIDAYARLDGLGARNSAFIECALDLGERAVSAVLERARLSAADVELFASSTVTGLAVPSLEARLMNRLSFRADCRRLPLFGLGCVAGAAGLARVDDYLRGRPKAAALLLCTELCSLTFQPDDGSIANVISCGLFGDGAACALVVGDEHPLADGELPAIVDTRSTLFADTERVMGWDVVDRGFRVVLSSEVPALAEHALPEVVRELLAAHDLVPADVDPWIAHPGGPAVINAMEAGLGLAPGTLQSSRDSLARHGNLSSASVLCILRETLATRPITGGRGLLLAMGPGFCAELLLLAW